MHLKLCFTMERGQLSLDEMKRAVGLHEAGMRQTGAMANMEW